jgi:hypothetical protein
MQITEYLNPLVTLIVGLFVFVIYYLNKRERVTTSAVLILNDVRSIERVIEEYLKDGDFMLDIYGVSSENWMKYQHLIVQKLDEDERKDIRNLFDTAMSFKQAISELHVLHIESLTSKTTKMQGMLIDIAHEARGNKESYSKMKKEVEDLSHSEGYWFKPADFDRRLERVLKSYVKISVSTTGKKLKELAMGKFW